MEYENIMNEKSIESKFGDAITGKQDLLGKAKPSFLFPFMVKIGACLLNNSSVQPVTKRSIIARRCINPIIKTVAPRLMKFKQVIESPYPELSDDSVIFVANHRFKDDVASSVAVSRHAYILVGRKNRV